MSNKISKRIVIFLATLLLSFFLPWQATAFLLLVVALFIEVPIEYIFLVVGIFGGGIFSILWFGFCVLGIFVREKTRLVPNLF